MAICVILYFLEVMVSNSDLSEKATQVRFIVTCDCFEVFKARLQRHNSTQLDVELTATQLSPTIGNATDPVEQRTANQREAGQSS